MRRHRKGKLRPDLDMIPLSTRHLGQSGCAKTCIRVKRLVKTNKRPFCRCRGMGRWDHQRELLAVRKLGVERGLRMNEYGVFRVPKGKKAEDLMQEEGERVGGETEEDIFRAV